MTKRKQKTDRRDYIDFDDLWFAIILIPYGIFVLITAFSFFSGSDLHGLSILGWILLLFGLLELIFIIQLNFYQKMTYQSWPAYVIVLKLKSLIILILALPPIWILWMIVEHVNIRLTIKVTAIILGVAAAVGVFILLNIGIAKLVNKIRGQP